MMACLLSWFVPAVLFLEELWNNLVHKSGTFSFKELVILTLLKHYWQRTNGSESKMLLISAAAQLLKELLRKGYFGAAEMLFY